MKNPSYISKIIERSTIHGYQLDEYLDMKIDIINLLGAIKKELDQ